MFDLLTSEKRSQHLIVHLKNIFKVRTGLKGISVQIHPTPSSLFMFVLIYLTQSKEVSDSKLIFGNYPKNVSSKLLRTNILFKIQERFTQVKKIIIGF